MEQSSLADRLGRYLHLAEPEREALAMLEDKTERFVPRGTVLRTEHGPTREIYAVRRGWMYSSLLMSDGRRQILGLSLPGDLAGDTGLPWDRAPFALTAVTDVVIRVIDKAALHGLFARQPRIAALLLVLAQVERVVLADRLASLGRTSAKARVAALLTDIARRLRASGDPLEDGMPLPLTQEEIGDLTGLTAVHVNRMMRQLADEGLIARTSGRVRVIDEARLAGIGHHIDRYAGIDLSWLPPAPR